MDHTAATETLDWSLEQAFARLARHERVEGLLYIGSLAKDTLTSASDYDLVIVLRDAQQPWYVGVTQIERRFTDLIFCSASEVDRLAELDTPVHADHELVPIIRWVANGSVVYDRAGRLVRVQRKLKQGDWVESMTDHSAYGSWFGINFNLAQAKRMVHSDDSVYRKTVCIRMALYGHMDLWFGYFSIRRIPFAGDKAAVRYLQANDSVFLDTYLQFVSEATTERKLCLYEQAAAIATAPMGGLWPPDHTVMNLEGALQTWFDLLEGDE